MDSCRRVVREVVKQAFVDGSAALWQLEIPSKTGGHRLFGYNQGMGTPLR